MASAPHSLFLLLYPVFPMVDLCDRMYVMFRLIFFFQQIHFPHTSIGRDTSMFVIRYCDINSIKKYIDIHWFALDLPPGNLEA